MTGRWMTIAVTGRPSEADDAEVPGDYLVSVPAGLDMAQAREAALDAFHEKIGIGCLDDFEFFVTPGAEFEAEPWERDRAVFHGRA